MERRLLSLIAVVLFVSSLAAPARAGMVEDCKQDRHWDLRIDDQACATELATAALRLNPDFTVDQYMRTRTYQDPADAAHLAEGLRAAGLPG